jgi:hypothetical protein
MVRRDGMGRGGRDHTIGPGSMSKKEAHAFHTCRQVDVACVNGYRHPNLDQTDRSSICSPRMEHSKLVASLRTLFFFFLLCILLPPSNGLLPSTARFCSKEEGVPC